MRLSNQGHNLLQNDRSKTGGNKLLLLGPDEETLDLLAGILPEYGFTVEIASDDRKLDEHTFDLILYDEVNGVGDGFRFWKNLPDGNAKDRFLLLGDNPDGEHISGLLRAGIVEHVTKPFDVDELAARIGRAIQFVEGKPTNDPNEVVGFEGDTEYLNLSDILMNLHQNVRTGKLYVDVEQGVYVYNFHRGELVKTAGPNGLDGKKAFYRAMREKAGKFRFIVRDRVSGKHRDEFQNLANIILHAVQEADEFPLSRKNLPEDPVAVSLSEKADNETLPDTTAVQPLLEGLIQSTTIDILIHACPKTDLDAARELEELMSKGILIKTESLKRPA